MVRVAPSPWGDLAEKCAMSPGLRLETDARPSLSNVPFSAKNPHSIQTTPMSFRELFFSASACPVIPSLTDSEPSVISSSGV